MKFSTTHFSDSELRLQHPLFKKLVAGKWNAKHFQDRPAPSYVSLLSSLISSDSSDSSSDSSESSSSKSPEKSVDSQILEAIFTDSLWQKDIPASIFPIHSLEYSVPYLPLPLSPASVVKYQGRPLALNSLQLAFCQSIASTLKTADQPTLDLILSQLRQLGELAPIDDPSSLDFTEIPDTKLPHSKKTINYLVLNEAVYSMRSSSRKFKVDKEDFTSVVHFPLLSRSNSYSPKRFRSTERSIRRLRAVLCRDTTGNQCSSIPNRSGWHKRRTSFCCHSKRSTVSQQTRRGSEW